jgi:hypothetical protein
MGARARLIAGDSIGSGSYFILFFSVIGSLSYGGYRDGSGRAFIRIEDWALENLQQW